jgi:hypothetical protein
MPKLTDKKRSIRAITGVQTGDEARWRITIICFLDKRHNAHSKYGQNKGLQLLLETDDMTESLLTVSRVSLQ